jgi:putative redox protein
VKVEVKYVDGLTFVGKGESNHWIPMDASIKAGGSGAGTSPMELLLLGLGGCTAVDVVSIMKKRRKPVQKFAIQIEAERAKEHPKVYTRIHMIYQFWGENLDKEELKKAIELSESKYCSASAMLGKTAEITYEIQMNPVNTGDNGQ